MNKGEEIIKMSHITVVQMLENVIGNKHSFDFLYKLSLKELEELRDELVVQYNDVLEGKRFGAEMIYGIGKKEDNKDQEVYFVNKKEWQEMFFPTNFKVELKEKGYTFLVNAMSRVHALDMVMYYLETKKMFHLYGPNLGPKYLYAGNNGMQFTSFFINVDVVSERKEEI